MNLFEEPRELTGEVELNEATEPRQPKHIQYMILKKRNEPQNVLYWIKNIIYYMSL